MLKASIMNFLMLFSLLNPINNQPAPSAVVPFNIQGQNVFCMQAVNDPKFHIAIRYDREIPNPPLLIDLFGKAILSKAGQENHYEPIIYTLKNVNISCPTSFVYSNYNRDFDNITLNFDVFIGYESHRRMTRFNVNIYPDIQSRWIEFFDTLRHLSIYTYYQSGHSVIVPTPLPISDVQAAQAVNEDQFSSDYICLVTKGEISGIKVNFGGRLQKIPKYKAVLIRVFDDEKPLFVKTVAAWPCPNGDKSHILYKPTIVVDNGIKNLKILWTFMEIESYYSEEKISLEELKKEKYFETDCTVRSLSQESDWISVDPHIFALETEYHTVVNHRDERFTRIRSVKGHKTLRLFRDYTHKSSYPGLSFEISLKRFHPSDCKRIEQEKLIENSSNFPS